MSVRLIRSGMPFSSGIWRVVVVVAVLDIHTASITALDRNSFEFSERITAGAWRTVAIVYCVAVAMASTASLFLCGGIENVRLTAKYVKVAR